MMSEIDYQLLKKIYIISYFKSHIINYNNLLKFLLKLNYLITYIYNMFNFLSYYKNALLNIYLPLKITYKLLIFMALL